MAVRFRKERGKWQCYWVNPWTKKVESVQCASEEDAHRTDDQIKYRLKWERESFRPEAKEVTDNIPDDCLETVYACYLREKRYPRNNLAAYLSTMKSALQALGRKRIGSITRQDLAMWIAKEQEAGATQCRIWHKKVHLYAVLRWAEEKGWVDKLPKLPRVSRPVQEHFIPPSTEELGRMIQVAPAHLQRVIILGSKMGMRVGESELLSLKWSDIDLEEGVVHLRAAHKNKREPIRDIPIMSSLLPLMRRWHDEDTANGLEYVVTWRGKAVKQVTSDTWHAILAKAGITRHVRPYDLRHAFATDMIASGVDVGTVAKLMGHAHVSMTIEHYQHVLDRQKSEAVESLPDVTKYVQPDMSNREGVLLQ